MELKYFYYISKPKVEMLLAQLHRTRFGLLSFTPRIEFAGLSIAGDLKTEPNKDLVADTTRLLKALRKRGAISKVSVDHEMDGRNFYHSEDLWRHGLFYFATLHSATVTYLLWREYNQSLILLAGSPKNIVGQTTLGDGIYLSSTGDAMDTLGSRDFLREIQTDEPNQSKNHNLQPEQTAFRGFTRVDWVYMFHTNSRSVPIAMFCFKHLTRLPQMQVDTVFKIFSKFDSVTGNCLSDLNLEHEKVRLELEGDDSTKPRWQQGAKHREFVEATWQTRIAEATKFGLQNYRIVYIGSPVYTAIA